MRKLGRKGVNVLGVLIAMACAFTALFALVKQLDFFNKVSFIKKAKAEHEQVSELISSVLLNTVMNTVEPATNGTCTSLGTRLPTALTGLQAAGAGVTFNHLAAGTLPFSYTGDEVHQAARLRCKDNQKFGNTESYADRSAIYFCVEIRPTVNTREVASVFSDGPVFAEVRVDLVDVQNDSSVLCKNFNDGAGNEMRGIEAYVALYWQKKRNNQPQFFTKRSRARIFKGS